MKIKPPISHELLSKLHSFDCLYEMIMTGHIYIEGYTILQKSDYDTLILNNPDFTMSNLTAWFTTKEAIDIVSSYLMDAFYE